jgi:hypothetical protein
VVFDSKGNPIKQLRQEFIPGSVKLTVDGREIEGAWW